MSCTIKPDEIKRVKGLGFLHNKGTNEFNGRVITGNGKITADQLGKIAEAANKHGDGTVCFTTRLTVECPGIDFENIEAFREDIAAAGLMTGGTGDKVRPVVSCKGTTCQYGRIDTFGLSEKIHERFFLGYNDVKLPHKFKIAVGGCPNNCVKPDLNDLGIVGQYAPTYSPEKCKGCNVCQIENACPMGAATLKNGSIDYQKELCNNCGRCVSKCPFGCVSEGQYGYKVYIGGRWGKKTAYGKMINHFFKSEDEILDFIEKVIEFYKANGKTKERFAETIERLGFENVEKELLK